MGHNSQRSDFVAKYKKKKNQLNETTGEEESRDVSLHQGSLLRHYWRLQIQSVSNKGQLSYARQPNAIFAYEK